MRVLAFQIKRRYGHYSVNNARVTKLTTVYPCLVSHKLSYRLLENTNYFATNSSAKIAEKKDDLQQ